LLCAEPYGYIVVRKTAIIGVLVMRENNANNGKYLEKWENYRQQELEKGGLSPEAKIRLQELIRKYDPINNKSMRINGKKESEAKLDKSRLPIPGTVITRKYKGKLLEVKVLEKGFEFEGKSYRSLTGIVKQITGSQWNGYNFFDL